jgi:xanthine dehydrogenase YagR molybdenum-binding subunit
MSGPILTLGSPQPPQAWEKTTVVGTRQRRIDGRERVSGATVYPSDVVLPGMLYGAVLRCPHPHAKARSIDTAKAAAMPGVRAVITGATPGCDLRWHYTREVHTQLLDPHCRHEGEEVAAVAAETPQQAHDAVRAIAVDWEVLPFVVDETRALDVDAPLVHESGNRVGEPSQHSRGDVTKGFAEADVVLEKSFRTDAELHTPMELHGCVARWDGGKLTLWESTQGVFRVQQQVADVLGVPLADVRVIGTAMGGGFGSKLQAGKYTILAALLARKAGAPVKLFLTREETYLCVGNRPATHMRLKAGVKKDGTLTAFELSVLGCSGAYPAGGAAAVDWLVRDLYLCPNVKTEATDVLINAGPARAMRAPGHPQGAWALEQMMDALAEAIGMDPVELRLKNVPVVSQAREGGPPYSSTGLRQCLEEGAKTFGWHGARSRRKAKGHVQRGAGVAAGLWIAGAGGPPSTVILKLFPDGSANLNMGASDIGTGTKTVMAMVVAEELGIPLEKIQVENADTATTQFATPSGGSKTVPTEAPAVRDAALKVKQEALALAAEQLNADAADLDLAGGVVVSRSRPDVKLPLAELTALRRRGVVVGVGTRGPNPQDRATCPFAAHFCEVEVNTRTGEVRLLRFVAAHDSGRVLNRLTYDNQVIGGITWGVGFAMTEARILDRNQTGKLVTRSWHDYKLPTALDVPAEVTPLPIDVPDKLANSTGAKGLGEPVMIPAPAAIANAVYDAVGVRCTETLIWPLQLVSRLAGRPRGGE